MNSSPELSPASVEFKDRSTGLKVFGVLTILWGLGVFALTGLMILSVLMAMARPATQSPTPIGPLIMAVGMYGLIAVALVWLGVGSWLARRWARALLAIGGWFTLIVGVFVLGFCLILGPAMIHAADLAAANAAAHQQNGAAVNVHAILVATFVTMGVIFGIFFGVIPLIWGLFYGSQNVKLTCETRDPVMRWTDACPLPVLAMSLCFGYTALFFPMMSLYGGVLPFFGMFLHGAVGDAACILLAILYGFLCWGFYQMRPAAWWAAVVVTIGYGLSSFLTFRRHTMGEMNALMGLNNPDTLQIQALIGGWVTGSALIFCAIFLIYLVWLRRYFFPKVVT